MTEWFFYQERGQTLGPVTPDEMRARVRDGRLRAFDLIYKEGDANWKMAMEHPDLRDVFREAGTNVMKGRPWVCLRKKGEDSFDYVTDGPFSDDEVKSALAAGRLGYSDYVWRDGYVDWKRIGNVETFNPRAKPQAAPPPPKKDPTAKELLSNIVELKRAGLPEVPPPPPEADGEDLTEEPTRIIVPRGSKKPPAPPPPPPQTKTRGTAVDIGEPETRVDVSNPPLAKAPAPPPAPPAARAETKSHTKTNTRSRKVDPPAGPPPELIIPRSKTKSGRAREGESKGRDWMIVAALVVAVVAGGAIFFVSRARHSAEKVAASDVVTAPPQTSLPALMPTNHGEGEVPAPPTEGDVAGQPASPPPTAAAPAPAPEPAESAPKQLKLSVQTSGGNKAQIDLRSDAPADTPIYVQVVGQPGHVADGATYYKYLRVSATGSITKSVDLSAIQLPQGSFRIAAEVGKERKETALDLGVGENKFRQSVGRQRKLAATAFWQERLRLYSASGQLASTLQKTSPGKSLGAKTFGNLDQVKKTTGEKYLFFDEWWELKQIVDGARKGVTAELQVRAKKAFDRAASLSVWRSKT